MAARGTFYRDKVFAIHAKVLMKLEKLLFSDHFIAKRIRQWDEDKEYSKRTFTMQNDCKTPFVKLCAHFVVINLLFFA